jgi:hypothetical protein
MAIFSGSAITGSISGKVGGIVFANAKGSKVARKRPKMPKRAQRTNYPGAGSPQTALQKCVVFWQGMSSADRAAWSTLAQQHPQPNRLGQSRPLTGFQLFLQWNLTTWVGVGVPRGDAPTNGAVDNFLTFTPTFEAGGPFNIAYTYQTGSAAQGFLIYGRTLFKNYQPKFQLPLRVVALYVVAPGGSPINVYPEWIAALPEPVTGQTVQIGARSVAFDYLRSPLIRTQTTIVP